MSKRIVIPGELVTEERKKLGSHVFIHEGKIYSDSMGLVNDESDYASVVPLEGNYFPRVGDMVIGVVTAEKFSVYMVDINGFYQSAISKRDMREILKPGSVISAKVVKVNEMNEVDLAYPRVFFGGEIIEVTPVKIPRIIGKEGSMLEVLKDGTASSIVVGKNGRIWAKGGNLALLREAIEKIDAEAHVENLTNKMTEFMENKKEKSENKVKEGDE